MSARTRARLARPPAEAEGHSYLVSASDLLAGFLFVFIIMVTSFAIDQAKDRVRLAAEKLKAERAQVKAEKAAEDARQLQAKYEAERRRVAELEKRATRENQRLRAAEVVRAELLANLKDELKKAGLDVTIDLEHGLMRLPEEVLFRSGTDEFSSGGSKSLEILATNLLKLLPTYAVVEGAAGDQPRSRGATLDAIIVEGHTDDRRKRADGRFQDNWDLSAARAIRTYKVLVQLEPELAHYHNEFSEPLFGVAGYADSRRVDASTDDDGRARNRRIDLRFLMAPPHSRGTAADAPRREGDGE